MCAVAMDRGWQICTAGHEFRAYSKALSVQMFPEE
jgi:hypothetical protein